MQCYVVFVLLAAACSQTAATVVNFNSSGICFKHIRLNKPNEALVVDFGNGPEDHCTSYVTWSGDKKYSLIALLFPKPGAEVPDSSAIPKSYINYTDYNNTQYRLDINGTKPYTVKFIPIYNDEFCPRHYTACSNYGCIHLDLVCESVVQCKNKSQIFCTFDPTIDFLVASLFAVIFASLMVSLILGLHTYFKFYKKVHSQNELKPRFYGTVNGSFESRISISSDDLGDSPPTSTTTGHYYQNIQHYNEYFGSVMK